jgi:hypothetical protein
MRASILALVALTGSVFAAPVEPTPWTTKAVDADNVRTANNIAAPEQRGGSSRPSSRDSVVTYNLKRVNDALVPLESSLKRKPRYFRSTEEIDDYFHQVWDLGNKVVTELADGAKDIRTNVRSISDSEILGHNRQISTMDTSLSNIVTGIIGSKKEVDQVRRRQEVLDLLLRAESETNAFTDAMLSKLTGAAQLLQRPIKAKFMNNIQRGVKEFRR